MRIEGPHELTRDNTWEQGWVGQYLGYVLEPLLINGEAPADKLINPLQEILILYCKNRVAKYPHWPIHDLVNYWIENIVVVVLINVSLSLLRLKVDWALQIKMKELKEKREVLRF